MRVNDPFVGPVYAAINLKGLRRDAGKIDDAFQADRAKIHLIVRRSDLVKEISRQSGEKRGAEKKRDSGRSREKFANSRAPPILLSFVGSAAVFALVNAIPQDSRQG